MAPRKSSEQAPKKKNDQTKKTKDNVPAATISQETPSKDKVELTNKTTEKDDSKLGVNNPLFGGSFNLDSDIEDSDEEQQQIHDEDTPTNKVGKVTLQKTDSGNPAARIIRIITSGGVNGWILYLEGFADKYVADIMFSRSDNKDSKKFVKLLQPVGRVVTVMYPPQVERLKDDEKEDEREEFRIVKHDIRKNSKGYKVRGLVFLAPKGHDITEEQVTQWYNERFLLAFKKTLEKRAFDLRPEQMPEIPKNESEIYHHWGTILPKADLIWVFNHFMKTIAKNNVGYARWLCKQSENLYSFWSPGNVPKDVISSYSIPYTILADEDAFKHNEHNNED